MNYTETAIFEPAGYLTAANIEDFQEQLAQAIRQPEFRIFVVDMTRVEFLDSAGLMALASCFRLAQSLGKRLGICSIPAPVQIIFELTQLDRVLEIHATREQLIACLTGQKRSQLKVADVLADKSASNQFLIRFCKPNVLAPC